MKWHSSVLIPFLTLSCNFSCRYCITKFAPDHNFSFIHLPTYQWLYFFNSIDGISDIIFNGGEPTLFPGFPEIINSLKPLRLIAIGTNYSDLATAALLKITPRDDLILDGSFHPHFISHHDISQNLLRLKAAGFKVRVHVLNYPQFKARPSSFIHDFQIQGIDAFLQQYEGFSDGVLLPLPSKLPACSLATKAAVKCSRSIYTPIAPDGTIYFCHYFMYSRSPNGTIGHISADQVSFPDTLNCRHYGWCNPCDLPRKAWDLSGQRLKPLVGA